MHGDLEAFRSILRQAELTDEAHRWKGGGATFVQTGDYTDRGAQVRAVMDLLISLEQEARRPADVPSSCSATTRR